MVGYVMTDLESLSAQLQGYSENETYINPRGLSGTLSSGKGEWEFW